MVGEKSTLCYVNSFVSLPQNSSNFSLFFSEPLQVEAFDVSLSGKQFIAMWVSVPGVPSIAV